MKTCTKCKQEKEDSEFGKRYDHPTKLLSWCRDCDRVRKRNAARKTLSNPEKRAATSYRQKLWTYGITHDEYQNLLAAHQGKCGVCSSESDLRIDHDHKTGAVRGLLCHHCNVALGHFKDSIDVLKNAIEYLCKNKSPHF